MNSFNCKNVRIMSEDGDTLLMSRRKFTSLLAALETLAEKCHGRRDNGYGKNSSSSSQRF